MCLRWRSFALLSIRLGRRCSICGRLAGQPSLFAIPGDREAKTFSELPEARALRICGAHDPVAMIELAHFARRQRYTKLEEGSQPRNRPGKSFEQPLRQENCSGMAPFEFTADQQDIRPGIATWPAAIYLHATMRLGSETARRELRQTLNTEHRDPR